MEFMQDCTTSVHKVEGFRTIHCRLYRNISERPVSGVIPSGSPSVYLNGLHRTASTIRQAGGLVALDSNRRCLWLFGQSEVQVSNILSSLSNPAFTNDTITLTNGTVLAGQSHSLKATQLLYGALCASNPLANHWAKVQLDAYEGVERSQGLPQRNEKALRNAYVYFVVACVQSLCFHLAVTTNLFPINFRTLVGTDLGCVTADTAGWRAIFTLDIALELTASGNLFISTKRSSAPGLENAVTPTHSAIDHHDKLLNTALVRIAPSGRVVQVQQPSLKATTPVSSAHGSDDNDGPDFIDQVGGPTGGNNEAWREIVLDSLHNLGLQLSDMTMDGSWLEVCSIMPLRSRIGTQSKDLEQTSELKFQWPACLCIGRRSTAMLTAGETSSVDLGFPWFQDWNQSSFKDPLQTALSFFGDETIRTAQCKTRQTTKTPSNKHLLFDSQSSATNTELQKISTVYPTPPDILVSGVTPGSMSLDGNMAPDAARSSRRHSGQEPNELYTLPHMDVDVESPRYALDTSSDAGLSKARRNEDDDDLYELNGITEADFSFFDEPGTDPQDSTLRVKYAQPLGNRVKAQDEIKDLEVQEIGISEEDYTQSFAFPRADYIVEKPPLADDNEELTNKDIVQKEPWKQFQVQSIPPSPPLDPSVIADRLRSLSPMAPPPRPNPTASTTSQSDNQWQPLHFRTTVGSSDRKYLTAGRFNFNPTRPVQAMSVDNKLYAQSESKGDKETLLSPSDPRLHVKKDFSGLIRLTRADQGFLGLRYDDGVENSSDSDCETSSSEDGLLSREPSHRRSKRRKIGITPGLTRQSSSILGGVSRSTGSLFSDNSENPVSAGYKETVGPLLEYVLVNDPADWSLTNFPPPSYTFPQSLPRLFPNAADFVAVGQLIAEQCSTNVESMFAESNDAIDESYDLGPIRSSSQVLGQALKSTFGRYGLSTLQTLPDLALGYQGSTTALVGSDPQAEEQVFELRSPSVRVQRADSSWEILPTAFKFWETLGLGPMSGQKSLDAYCIYPDCEGLQDHVSQFFRSIESAWDSCRLGRHQMGSHITLYHEGLIPLRLQSVPTLDNFMSTLRKICSELAQHKFDNASSIVIYMVNPLTDEASLQGLCACFLALLQAYDNEINEIDPKKEKTKVKPVLQIVPMRLITSSDGPIFFHQDRAARFARSVYDRCPSTRLSHNEDLRIFSPGAIGIADSTPKSIHFKLTAEPPSDLSREHSCMHVAYCQSLDDQWISVAWSDSTGRYQHMASYSLAGNQSFRAVAQEIWDSTCVYVKDRNTKWLISVAKVGPFDFIEHHIWKDVISTTAQPVAELNVLLTSVITNPVLEVYYSPPEIVKSSDPETILTPMATPQPQVFSPPPTTPGAPLMQTTASTPTTIFGAMGGSSAAEAADADPSTRLIDITDQTWGIILERSLSVTRSIIDYNPALASGYLMKRTGPDVLDPPVLLEVNIMDMITLPGTIEDQPDRKVTAATVVVARRKLARQRLKEVLVEYRGLALLARLRGMEGVGGCRPWHVVVVEKAVDALRRAMPMPDRLA